MLCLLAISFSLAIISDIIINLASSILTDQQYTRSCRECILYVSSGRLQVSLLCNAPTSRLSSREEEDIFYM